MPEVPAVEPLAGSPSARVLLHAVATAPAAPAPKARDAGGQADYELKDLQASQFFLDCMDNNGHVRPLKDARRHPEADGVLNALKAMASPEETQVLQIRGRDAGQQGHAVAVAEQVVRHLVSRLLREYADKNDTKTPGRLAKSTVYVNTLDKHLKSSKLNISSRAFQAWRADPKAPIVGQRCLPRSALQVRLWRCRKGSAAQLKRCLPTSRLLTLTLTVS